MAISHRTLATSALVLGLLLNASQVFAADTPPSAGPWIGVWKNNPEKTAAANGQPAATVPQGTRIFRMVQVGKDAFYYAIESAPAGSNVTTTSAALLGRFDGKDYMEIGNPGADTNKFRIVDANTYELTDTKDGKDLMTFRVTISADGKTRTSVSGGKNAKGEPIKPSTSVSERID